MKTLLHNTSVMKKFIPVVALAVVMTACNTSPKVDSAATTIPQQVQPAPDTAGLAQFQQWKAQNELAMYNQYQANQSAASAQPATRTVVKYYPQKSSSRSSSPVYSGNSSSSSTAKKSGWSKAAKGAVIGGVGGAAAGAVINKRNRAAGAVIGGVLGAGAGYGIGRGMDKRDGRY